MQNGKGCGDYDGDFEESSQCPHALGRLCSKKLCGNGKRVAEGIHCGKGSCNSFGGNCDGGCIEGDPEQNLLKQYPPSIAWRCYSIFSETSELSLGWSKPLSLVIRYVCCDRNSVALWRYCNSHNVHDEYGFDLIAQQLSYKCAISINCWNSQ